MNFIYFVKFSTSSCIKLDSVIDVDMNTLYNLIKITSLSSTFPSSFFYSLSLYNSCIS